MGGQQSKLKALIYNTSFDYNKTHTKYNIYDSDDITAKVIT